MHSVHITRVLCLQTDRELYYKFSPVLMQHLPKKTVNAWIEQKRKLDPRKLIPALVHYHQDGKSEQVLAQILLTTSGDSVSSKVMGSDHLIVF